MPSCLPRFVLVAAALGAVSSGLFAQIAAPVARATASGETTVVLDPFAVQSSACHGCTATRSSTGTRIAADIKDIPFSVDVVPLEIWKDLAVQAFNQQEALSSIPGVSATENNGQFNLRGIQNGAVTGGTFFLQDSRWSHQVSVALKNAFDSEYAYGTRPSQGNPRQGILRYSLLFK